MSLVSFVVENSSGGLNHEAHKGHEREEGVSVAPLGLVSQLDGNPRLTPWATVFRPSGPGGGALRSDEVIPTLGALGGSA